LMQGLVYYLHMVDNQPWLRTPEAQARRTAGIRSSVRRGTYNNGRKIGWWRIGAGTSENQKLDVSRRMRGVPKTIEHRLKIAASTRGKSKGPHSQEWREDNSVRMLEIWSKRGRRWWRNHAGRTWISKPEASILRLMTNLGFVSQYKLAGHFYDYGSHEQKMVVEVHGCYYHAHICQREIGYRPDHRKTWLKDRKVICRAVDMGYRVLLLWECKQKTWRRQICAFVMEGGFEIPVSR
jgi:G:T-mismatch repair DNA endonuclease (very short patch repair protein)